MKAEDLSVWWREKQATSFSTPMVVRYVLYSRYIMKPEFLNNFKKKPTMNNISVSILWVYAMSQMHATVNNYRALSLSASMNESVFNHSSKSYKLASHIIQTLLALKFITKLYRLFAARRTLSWSLCRDLMPFWHQTLWCMNRQIQNLPEHLPSDVIFHRGSCERQNVDFNQTNKHRPHVFTLSFF